MTTELAKFTDAYASITVASYQPLILQWTSLTHMNAVASELAHRVGKSSDINWDGVRSTVSGLQSRPISDPPSFDIDPPQPEIIGQAQDVFGDDIPRNDINRVNLQGFPNAVEIGGQLYPHGVTGAVGKKEFPKISPGVFSRIGRLVFGHREATAAGDPALSIRSTATIANPALGSVSPPYRFHESRRSILGKLIEAAERQASDPQGALSMNEIGKHYLDLGEKGKAYILFPNQLQEALSPIGIAHFFRQYFFNISEGVGPIEEAFTIAPKETFEVIYESVRRQVQEELQEIGSEIVSERAEEQMNTDEVSDKVSTMIQRDVNASISAMASGSVGVFTVGAQTEASFDSTSSRGRDTARRNLREKTRRASERITKSYKLTTRALDELTTTNRSRRVISNPTEVPVSYGLRRVLQRINVKVQDLGPRLIWQLYLRKPGSRLVKSRFVHFRGSQPISELGDPPGLEPRPSSGTDSGVTASGVRNPRRDDNRREIGEVTILITPTSDRRVTAISIDSMHDVGGSSLFDCGADREPVPARVFSPVRFNRRSRGWEVVYTIFLGNSNEVSVNYTYSYEPSQQALDRWIQKKENIEATQLAEAQQAAFEREKELITERSKIRPRPANDLRAEERHEILNRMIDALYARDDDPSNPAPLEIESVHRLFSIESIFAYAHPSWWKPRYSRGAINSIDQPYEITADSEPAPIGKSLGWVLQEDGDDRRNAFLNSPWVRVCIPIQPHREREALRWLSRHIEGEIGYDESSDPLKSLLEEIEEFREKELDPDNQGPNYAISNSEIIGSKRDAGSNGPALALQPHEELYPIIDEFEVTAPTDGFVYDELIVNTS